MRIIVIKKTDYKEKDTIIDAITETGPVSFKVRGSNSSNSHLAWINNPLTVADVEYVENVRYRHQILKNASLVYSPIRDTSFDRMLFINLIVDVANNMFSRDEQNVLYDLLIELFEFTDKTNDLIISELLFLANAIRLSGFEPEVNRCVSCGSKSDIVAFSFTEGGFICRNCLESDMIIDLNPSQMKWMRYLFNRSNFVGLPESTRMSKEDQVTIFTKIYEYIYESIGIRLGTIKEIINNI